VSLTRAQTKALLEGAALRPKRKYGQNFVVDANTLARIVRLSGVEAGESVLEIGTGLGALTEALLSAGCRVTSLEVDPDLVALAAGRAELEGARLVSGDALVVGLDELAPVSQGPWTMVANLPYNVATHVIVRCLEEAPQISKILVMIQAEVGERLAAKAGEEAYGALSVRVAYHAQAKVLGRVPPSVFVPQPKVESVLVSLTRRDRPAVDPALVSEDALFSLVRQAFAQRRKMLRRSLAGRVGDEAFERAGVAPTARPEELDLEAWGRLAQAVS
jgi:16S rRNA (adenine1518-N6/adenine1519-N6)-dimethyltransferase